jgi:hypothetical protein
MVRRFVARVVHAAGLRVKRVRGKLRVATGFGQQEVLAFWRDHGAEWAREEAALDDLKRVVSLIEAVQGLSDKDAAARIATLFRQVWDKGFASADDAWGWDEMSDSLPDLVLLAFARGAEAEYRLRSASA